MAGREQRHICLVRSSPLPVQPLSLRLFNHRGLTGASRGPPASCACRFPVGFAVGRPLKLNVSAQAPALMLASVAYSSLPSVMAQLSALPVLACRCRALLLPSVLSVVRAARRRALLRSSLSSSSSARLAFRRGARPSLPLARFVAVQPVSLPHVGRSVALGGPLVRKNHRLLSRSASASSGGSSWRRFASRSASAPGLLSLLSGASCSSIRVGANPAVKGTACKLRLQVPYGLRPPAAPYLER